MKLILILFSIMISPFTHATLTVIGSPTTGGTGCPMGAATITVSPDGQYLDFFLPDLVVEAGALNGMLFKRVSCDISIPVQVPANYSVRTLDVKGQISVDLETGARASVRVKSFFDTAQGLSADTHFQGPTAAVVDYVNVSDPSLDVWSPCGQNTRLRLQIDLQATSSRSYANASLRFDSIEGMGLQFRRCN